MSRNTTSIIGTLGAVTVAALVAWAASDNGVSSAGLPAIVWCAIAAFAVNWIAFVPSWLQRTERFYDLTGSLTYISVVALAMVLGGGDGAASWLMAALIWVWAGRLGSFLFRRVRAGGDRRFDRIKTDPLQLFMTWTLQGLWVFLTAVAALTAMTGVEEHGFGPVVVIGLIVWAIGFAIEVRADAEKSAFRRDPANAGRFISSGLWAWSRHPNYFGEITLWVGMAIIALPGLDGWQYIALISPVFVTLLLTRISGLPMLERNAAKRWGDDPAYQRYVESTPVLIPRPPAS